MNARKLARLVPASALALALALAPRTAAANHLCHHYIPLSSDPAKLQTWLGWACHIPAGWNSEYGLDMIVYPAYGVVNGRCYIFGWSSVAGGYVPVGPENGMATGNTFGQYPTSCHGPDWATGQYAP
jgi:hypothetical protein